MKTADLLLRILDNLRRRGRVPTLVRLNPSSILQPGVMEIARARGLSVALDERIREDQLVVESNAAARQLGMAAT